MVVYSPFTHPLLTLTHYIKPTKRKTQNTNHTTLQIEHVSVPALSKLESLGVAVRPSSSTIRIIQDKLVQKDHFASHSIPLPRYRDCPTAESVHEAIEEFGLPLMLKSRKEGYDGRGNAVVKTKEDVEEKFEMLYNGGKSGGGEASTPIAPVLEPADIFSLNC